MKRLAAILALCGMFGLSACSAPVATVNREYDAMGNLLSETTTGMTDKMMAIKAKERHSDNQRRTNVAQAKALGDGLKEARAAGVSTDAMALLVDRSLNKAVEIGFKDMPVDMPKSMVDVWYNLSSQGAKIVKEIVGGVVVFKLIGTAGNVLDSWIQKSGTTHIEGNTGPIEIDQSRKELKQNNGTTGDGDVSGGDLNMGDPKGGAEASGETGDGPYTSDGMLCDGSGWGIYNDECMSDESAREKGYIK